MRTCYKVLMSELMTPDVLAVREARSCGWEVLSLGHSAICSVIFSSLLPSLSVETITSVDVEGQIKEIVASAPLLALVCLHPTAVIPQ